MRWWTFIMIAVVALTLQTALAPRLSIWGARPDWILVLCVFVGLHARRWDAVLAAWILGLCADLMSLERVGLLALSYATIAWFVGSIREYLFRHHALTQFVVTFVAALLVQIGWLVYRRTLYSFDEPWVIDLTRSIFWTPLYTAVWAPVAHRALLAAASALGLPRPRYNFAGSQTAGVRRV